MTALDADTENRLAKLAQAGVPLVPRPFHALGETLGVSEEAVLSQMRAWTEDGRLREISAVIEGSGVGYESALVAGAIPASDVDRVADIISAHPTVTHNYLRDHAYNLWFTIAVPHEIGLDAAIEALAEQAGVDRFHPLRRTHTFKIGVNFDLRRRENETTARPLPTVQSVSVGPTQRRIVRALQCPLPHEPRPFAVLAEQAGVTEDEVLAFASRHLGGIVRKYVATFNHRRLGVRGNGMAVWNVPEERFDVLGPRLASAPEVSHCYARNAIPGFPYTLYSMLHAPDEAACREIARRLSTEIDVDDYAILFSTREYKKCRLRYFLPELDEWWDSTQRRRRASA